MSTFMGFAIGTVFGFILGSVGMLLLIRETALDAVLEREEKEMYKFTFYVGGEKIDAFKSELHHCMPCPAPELDWEDELEQPQEVKYGEF